MGIISYLKETKGELKHVNWPTRRQSIVFTSLIIVISVVVAALLGFFDWIFTSLVELFV